MNGDDAPSEGAANTFQGTIHGASLQAQNIHGGVQFHLPPQAHVPVPAQLPAAGFFVDRRAELGELHRLAGKAGNQSTIVVITGPGGVGKTTLGLHWLHRIRDSYGDGQLFIDLRGFSGDPPMPVNEPLGRFLRALGVNAGSIPVGADEQAGMFRSLTTGKRLIIMLDNALSAAQVRPLLPGPGPNLVVVTTRHRLSGLVVDGASFVEVDPLNDSGAVELLDRMLGTERIRAERDAAILLVRLCGHLPLAVCASGARLVTRRRWPISRVVAELTDETSRLSTLHVEEDEMSVRATFNGSYSAIAEDETRRLYRLLGLHPGSDFGADSAGALIEADEEDAVRRLDTLVDANLLRESGDGRYRFHDLLRLHARDKAHEVESAADRDAALSRLADRYLRKAVAADLAVQPGRWHIGDYYAAEGELIDSFADGDTALEWLEMERSNLISVMSLAHRHGLHDTAWQICEAMWNLFLIRKHYSSWIEAHRIGEAAARARGDHKALARMLEWLGFAYLNLRDFPAAVTHYREALELEESTGHRLGEASALEGLGIAGLATGDNDHAIELFTRARAIHEDLGRPRGVALMTRHIGNVYIEIGDHSAAIAQYTAALAYFREADEKYHQARTSTVLATAYLRSGRLDDADEAARTALAISERTGARHEWAGAHVVLADLAASRREPAREREHLRQALEIYAELGAPQAETVRRRLDDQAPGRA